MKKNRARQETARKQADQLPEKSGAENILVFLVLAIVLLAASLFSSHRQFLHKNMTPVPSESPENYIWLTGSSGMPEGLYLFTDEQLEAKFPALDVLHDAFRDANPPVHAVRYQGGKARTALLPPAVANIFLQPLPINRADADILTSLPGIGPVLAERIVQWRDQHGSFSAKDELLLVTGIGPKKFAGLVDRVTLD